ncbi:MAG: hypothetical protein Q7U18_02855 [Methylobacter sp.]|nr:hypothetical protein [Methylobacter sp.]
MTSRLDELFSPDRLRQNWPMKITSALEPKQAASHLKIRANYDELQCLIGKNFPDVSRLSARFDALTEAINQAFPADATTDPADAQQKEAIVVMLEQLETLLWAMDLSLGTVR